jgi:hypothetical protein
MPFTAGAGAAAAWSADVARVACDRWSDAWLSGGMTPAAGSGREATGPALDCM